MRTPETEAALADFIRESGPVLAFGRGTKRHHGPAPAPGASEVSLEKLNRIVAYEPGDLVVSVQAGARLADLQAELAKHGQWLPIDPPYADATIGGILATNSSGPRRLAYGTMRDHVLGARVVGPDGGVTKSGGRVVKNVTGFDLHKLHIGAFGTLGIVTEANFKLRPRPDVSAVIVLPCRSFEEAHARLLEVHASPLRPVALEALDAGATARLRKLVPHLPSGESIGLVGVEGTRSVLERHLRDLRTPEALEGARAEALWSGLRDLPERSLVRVRLASKPHDLPKLLATCAGRIARVGSGVAWMELQPASDLPERIAGWNAAAAALGGYAVVESAPLDLPGRERLPWGVPANTLMRAIRESRDPRMTLNPGRMVIG